jgi:hypothetical protein
VLSRRWASEVTPSWRARLGSEEDIRVSIYPDIRINGWPLVLTDRFPDTRLRIRKTTDGNLHTLLEPVLEPCHTDPERPVRVIQPPPQLRGSPGAARVAISVRVALAARDADEPTQRALISAARLAAPRTGSQAAHISLPCVCEACAQQLTQATPPTRVRCVVESFEKPHARVPSIGWRYLTRTRRRRRKRSSSSSMSASDREP